MFIWNIKMINRRSFLFKLNLLKYFSSQSINCSNVQELQNVSKISESNQDEALADCVTPLWRTEYKEQLYLKKKWAKEVIQELKLKKIAHAKTVLHNIIPSPTLLAYRNKDEFNIRTGVDGNPKTVGFFVGRPGKGECVCIPPTHLMNIKPTHCEIAKIYQDIIRKSPLRACHDFHDGGFWRTILVRSNNKEEHMITVSVNPNRASPTEIEEAKDQLLQGFISSPCKLHSLYFQECPNTRCTSEEAPFQLLHGEPHIYETIENVTFMISPDSFFQINTGAAPLLYRSALGFCKLAENTTLLDLCCGTGALSLLASPSVRGCIGMEIVDQSIQNAKMNAKINGIENCHFFTGRIEHKMEKIFQHLQTTLGIVAVLNPGRAGISRKGIKVLREFHQLKQIIYISCKADTPSTFHNFVDLCHPKFSTASPFCLTDAQPVDMFPHTNHYELVLNFQRFG